MKLPHYSLMVLALSACSIAFTSSAHASVSAEEAARLNSDLTPRGAERAGNKDGSIPAWTGGYTETPAGYKAGQVRPDPFAAEKPLYSITAKNMAQYADKLTDGQQLLLKKFPTYRIDVYPTHRTAAAPKAVYDSTFKNATRAKSTNDGLSVEGAYGGTPFPIPKTGAEVMWNHLLRWNGQSVELNARAYVVSGSSPILASRLVSMMSFPYYQNPEEKPGIDFWKLYQLSIAPAFKAGETILLHDPVDQMGEGRQAWQYLVGQRRVRRAPSIGYDTPSSLTSGVDFFDEGVVYNGKMDKYQWKLLGKAEMIVPYNMNDFHRQKADVVLGPDFLNPDHVRWELHRVWVVEATLAPGKRHVLPKRKFYVDEDSWGAVWADGWDAKGQLWHSSMGLPLLAPDMPGQIHWFFTTYDHLKGAYSALFGNEEPSQWKAVPQLPDSTFSPEAMAAHGVN